MDLRDARGKVDFGIITIREDEFEAVLACLPPAGRITGQRQYNLRRVELPGGDSYLVAVVRCIEQGNGEAQSAARDLLEDLEPQWLLVVGIAGGVPSDQLTLGDVIVSTRIHDFSVEAALQDSPPEYALAGGPIEKSAAALVANLPALKEELGDWNTSALSDFPRPAIPLADTSLYGGEEWRQQVRASLAKHAGRTHPSVIGGAIASSDRLIKDTDVLRLWLKLTRHVLAIEMESAGVYRACHERQVPTLSIRGISDIVGLQREPAWTQYACKTAAAFALALMRTRPLEPSGHTLPAAHPQKLRSWVARYPLPTVAEVDPYQLLGVTESELARTYAGPDERPPYVLRDADQALEKALSKNDLILIVGHSKAGKSRTAFEAAFRLYPQHPLIIPANGKALSEFFSLEPPLPCEPNPAILWLDDLHRFLGPEGLTSSLLNTLAQDKGRLKILATLTAKQYEDYMRSGSELAKDAQLILRRFQEMRLSSGLSAAETERAQDSFPNEPREKLAKGLGEHMIAARELMKKFEAGKETCPEGYALVHAAIDWRRAGIHRPVPEPLLSKLTAQYLRFLELSHVDLSPDSFEVALQWARGPVGHHVALLSKKKEEEQEKYFEAFDYIVDSIDRQAAAVPQEAWDAILALVPSEDMILMGITASQQGHRARAKKAFSQAHVQGTPPLAPWAAFFAGAIFLEEGNSSEAEGFYRAAIAAQQPLVSALSAIDLGTILRTRGDVTEAEQLFRAAIDSKHPRAAALAMVNLGGLLNDRGEGIEAEQLYRTALDAQQPDASPFAMNNLATLLQDRGDVAEAERLFRAAIDSQHPDAAAMAMNNLGRLLENRRDLEEAERLYLAAVNSKRPKAMHMAMLNVGRLFQNRGELADAERLYRSVSTSGDPVAAALASVSLGKLLQDGKELTEAERLYRAAIRSQHPAAKALAMNNLGTLLKEKGDLAEAERLFRAAIDTGQSEASALGKNNLAILLQDRGEMAEAERLYLAAIASNHLDAATAAMSNLGKLLNDTGMSTQAEKLYRTAIGSHRPEISAAAMNNLGNLLRARADVAEAERLYRAVVASGPSAVAAAASINLGRLLRDRGEVAEAEQLFRAALDSQYAGTEARAVSLELCKLLLDKGELAEAERLCRATIGPEPSEFNIVAMNNLAGLLLAQGKRDEAEHFYRRVVDSKHPSLSPVAALPLAGLLQNRGEWAEAERLYRTAIGCESSEISARAAFDLAEAHLARGQFVEAERLYRILIASAHVRLSAAAMNPLGFILLERGEVDEAENLLRAAITSKVPEVAPVATLNLARLRQVRGDLTEAKRLYHEAIDSGHTQVAEDARSALAALGDTGTDANS